MKNKIYLPLLILTITSISSNKLFSQTIPQTNFTGDYWESLDFTATNPPQAFGVGNFLWSPSHYMPASALHINTINYTPSFFNAGEVFRTDAPATSGVTTLWRMLHGGTNVFNLSHTNGSANMDLISLTTGSMVFYTVGNPYMELTNGGDLNLFQTSPGNASSTNAYEIGGNPILWHNGITTNIYLGVTAGNAHGSTFNTFLGCSTGNNNHSASYNTFVGAGAGQYNDQYTSSDDYNTFVGALAGNRSQGSSSAGAFQNNFFGYQAGAANTGTDNNFMGANAGLANTSGSGNTFIGSSSGKANTTGGSNIFIAGVSGKRNTTGMANIFIGEGSGEYNLTGGENVFLGVGTGVRGVFPLPGFPNNIPYLGGSAGSNNTFIGYSSGQTVVGGHDNTLVGHKSDFLYGGAGVGASHNYTTSLGAISTVDADYAIAIGYNSSSTAANATSIGANSIANNANTIILGDYTTNPVTVGIGLSNPNSSEKLEIKSASSGTSGLRFTNLPNTTSPITNTTSGVLSVDNNGRVILVTDQGGMGSGTVTSVGIATTGTGLSVISGSPVTTNGIITLQNTAPDQMVVLTGTGGTTITSAYPNFTINSTNGTVTSVGATAGAGIAIGGTASPIITNGTYTITNTAPDQTVVLTAGAGIAIGGSGYPNFTITNTAGGTITDGRSGVSKSGTYIELGRNVTATSGNELLHHTEIPMLNGSNEYNIYFSGQSTHQATPADIGIGYPALTSSSPTALSAKLDVLNNTAVSTPVNLNAGRFITASPSYTYTTGNYQFTGVTASSDVTSTAAGNINMGGSFTAANAKDNRGLWAQAGSSTNAVNNYGVTGIANNASYRGIGVIGSSSYNANENYGVYGLASNNNYSNTVVSYGVYGRVDCDRGGKANYAVYGTILPHHFIPGVTDCATSIHGPTNIAGYFNGAVYSTGGYLPSDSMLKENIDTLTGDSALYLINQLEPKTYLYDVTHYPSMALPSGGQYGLIAENVEAVLPGLVKQSIQPTTYDSVGTALDTAVTFKALNYTGLIPILVAAVKQLSTHPSTTDNAISIGTANAIEWGSTALKHHTEIPMLNPADKNEYNIYFTGQSLMQNSRADIGVGYATSDNLEAKVDVLNTTAAHGENQFTNAYAGRFITDGNYADSHAQDLVGVKGVSSATNGDGGHNTNIGGDFYARNGIINIGVRGIIDGTYKPNSTNYAVYGEAMDTTNYWAGYFNGYIGTTAGWIQASDRALKKDIQPMTAKSSMDILSKLKPSTYSFKTDGERTVNLPHEKQYGLIADEVKKQLPELVRPMNIPAKKDKQGNIISPAKTFEGVNYTALIPLLISAVQSLDSTNKVLAKQVSDLQNCCAYNSTVVPTNTGNNTSVELNDLAIILDQNAPNPFAEQTVISYTIPETVKEAKIMFYTSNGIVMKDVVIAERGKSSMTVYASNLSAGIYSYSLIADGKMIDTKKMVCQKR